MFPQKRCETTAWLRALMVKTEQRTGVRWFFAAEQKQLAGLLQQTSISDALTLRANIVDSPHDQPQLVGKVSALICAQF